MSGFDDTADPKPWDRPDAPPLTAATRAALLVELRSLAQQRAGRAWRLDDLLHLYREGLPRLPIARDPHGGDLVEASIDTFGLDGPFWDYHAPVRPADDLPESVFALTGAMKLGARVPSFAHLAKVGPGAPFVVPRLLAHESVIAVISEVTIGRVKAWPVTYFAAPPLLDHHRFNTWGTNRYYWRGPDGAWRWNDCTEDAEELDFNLKPWIEEGRLRWIAPGDTSAALHDTSRSCPYIGLKGTRAFQRVSHGKVWTQLDR